MQQFDFRRLHQTFYCIQMVKILNTDEKNATFHFPFSWGFFRSFFFFCFLPGIPFLHYTMIGYEGILERAYNISIILCNFVKDTFTACLV